jgi:predicted NodU family carbamoyl transferase
MEWGPRALGNRSILCDPRRPDMKATLNDKYLVERGLHPAVPRLFTIRARRFLRKAATEGLREGRPVVTLKLDRWRYNKN